MIREFALVWDHRGLLLEGFLTTLWLAVLGETGSLLLGALLSAGLMSRRPAAASAGRLFVDTMRCMPFLLFAYIIYYGLPSVGLSLGNSTAGLLALVLYHLAYTAELLRGAWAELPPEQMEAGRAFGFKGLGLLQNLTEAPSTCSAARLPRCAARPRRCSPGWVSPRKRTRSPRGSRAVRSSGSASRGRS